MTYTKKQFLEDVKKEAVALKKHATPTELANLDFETLDGGRVCHCVYGQLTGNCTSDRAIELITKCAPVYLKFSTGEYDAVSDCEYSEAYWSPIERYIREEESLPANLIDFLKGNRKDLVL